MQMRRLAPVFEGLDVAYVSVQPGYADDVPGHRRVSSNQTLGIYARRWG